MAAAHWVAGLSEAVDAALALAALLVLLRRPGLLPLLGLLLAVDPLWALGLQALAGPLGLLATPGRQVVLGVLADAPLWAAFILGLLRLFAPPAPAGRGR